MLKQTKTIKNIVATLGLIILSATFLTSCSAGVNKNQTATVTEQQLSKQMVDTMCLLKDKSIVTDDDVTAFKDLATKMRNYDGDNATEINEAGNQVDSMANTYDTAVGKDLGTEAAQKHTAACESLTKSFEEEYGK